MLFSGAQLDILLRGGGARGKFFSPPPQNISRKMSIILKQ